MLLKYMTKEYNHSMQNINAATLDYNLSCYIKVVHWRIIFFYYVQYSSLVGNNTNQKKNWNRNYKNTILCLWFRASLIYSFINNCPTRCNTKQSTYYSASSLYMFRVPATPIIMTTQNCNYSLRYCSTTSLQCGHVGGR